MTDQFHQQVRFPRLNLFPGSHRVFAQVLVHHLAVGSGFTKRHEHTLDRGKGRGILFLNARGTPLSRAVINVNVAFKELAR